MHIHTHTHTHTLLIPPRELQVHTHTHTLYVYAHIHIHASIRLIPRLLSCRVPGLTLTHADPSSRNLPIIRPTKSVLRRGPRLWGPLQPLKGGSWEDGMISKAASTSMVLMRWMRHRGKRRCHMRRRMHVI